MGMSRARIHLALLLAVVVCCFGCGGGKSAEVDPNDALAVENDFAQKARRHHPTDFAEVELGDFFVVHQKGGKQTLFLQFQLFGVMPNEDQAEFTRTLATHKDRMKEVVMQTVRSSAAVTIADPYFKTLRNELVKSINKKMKTNKLRDIIITKLTISRG